MVLGKDDPRRFEMLADHLAEECGVDGEFLGIPIYEPDGTIKLFISIIFEALKIANEKVNNG